jgi:hypothetical protein
MATVNRMKDYRAKLRQQGLRPVQIWVADQRNENFRDELKKQIERLDNQDERESLEFIAQASELADE